MVFVLQPPVPSLRSPETRKSNLFPNRGRGCCRHHHNSYKCLWPVHNRTPSLPSFMQPCQVMAMRSTQARFDQFDGGCLMFSAHFFAGLVETKCDLGDFYCNRKNGKDWLVVWGCRMRRGGGGGTSLSKQYKWQALVLFLNASL